MPIPTDFLAILLIFWILSIIVAATVKLMILYSFQDEILRTLRRLGRRSWRQGVRQHPTDDLYPRRWYW